MAPSEQPEQETSGEEAEKPIAEEVIRFSPEDEAELLKESTEQKLQANKLFGSSRYSEAIQEYDKALATCPNYLEYEIAVLKSNISACHLKLENWKAAVDSATASLESLARLLPLPTPEELAKKAEKVVELEEGEDEDEANATIQGHSREDIERIRAKALMRRAKARTQLGGWAALGGAEEDYKTLSLMPNLPPSEKRIVAKELSLLGPRLEKAKETEMAEMMSKLKGLGNSILKPFGLSTDNFNMVKDPTTGGYSMQFNQGSGGSNDPQGRC